MLSKTKNMKNKTKLYKEFFEAVNSKMAIERLEVHTALTYEEKIPKINYYSQEIDRLRKLINN